MGTFRIQAVLGMITPDAHGQERLQVKKWLRASSGVILEVLMGS